MAEQIISPGVFTKENDLSFLPQGVEAIGAAIVGPTTKGPAFHPMICKSFAEFERKFGGLSNDTFVPQTVREYIRSAGAVTVVRVLAGGGWSHTTTNGAPIAIGLTHEGTAAGTITLNVDDGDADLGSTAEKQYIEIRDGFGNNIKYVIVHSGGGSGAVATGTVLTSTSDTGAGTAGAALEGGVAVNVNLSSTTRAQMLNELRTAILATDAHNEIVLGDAVANTDGAKSILLTFPKGIPSDPQDVLANTIGNLSTSSQTFASTSDTTLVGVLFPAMDDAAADPGLEDSTLTTSASLADNFPITLNGTGHGSQNYSASLNPANSNYLFKQLGYKSTVSKTGATAFNGTNAYTYIEFKNILTEGVAGTSDIIGLSNTSSIVMSEINDTITYDGNGLGYTEKYSYASTPTITSGFLDPGANSTKSTQDLFTFHTLAHGTATNTDFKISIVNQKTYPDIDGVEQYCTFDVHVRKYSDKDKSPNILEQFNGCNLNPDDANYIGKKIGDRYSHYNTNLDKLEILGSFNNMSEYIRVEVNAAVEAGAISPKLLPKGFKAVVNPFPMARLDNINNFPSASYESVQEIGGNYNTKAHLGWKFDEKRTDNKNWLKPLTNVTENNGAGAFNVDNHTGHASSGLWTGALSASIDATAATGPNSSQIKFSVPFQGGDDGIAPWKPRFTGAVNYHLLSEAEALETKRDTFADAHIQTHKSKQNYGKKTNLAPIP